MCLELASTEELIHELQSRTTFVGVIVRSHSEHRNAGQSHKNFTVYDATGGNLEVLLGHIIEKCKEEND
jgi:hypothetical protein